MDDKTRNKVLLVLFLGVLMGALDIAIVAPALPSIQAYFGIGTRVLTWTFTIYVLFNLIGTPLMAKLSDMFGRRSIYTLDVALFAVGSLIVALAPANMFAMFLVGRAMQGFGAGGIFPVASAVIGDTFPPEKRGGALGLIGAVFGLAFLVGPILGGVILTFTGWQWLFIINLPIALTVILMGWRVLPVTHPATNPPFDWAGMLALGVMLASLAFGLNQINVQNFFPSLVSLNVWPFLLTAIILLFVFTRLEKKADAPILNLNLFKSRQSMLASMLSAGAGLGESGMVFIPALAVATMPTIINTHNASYLLMPVVLAMAFGSPLVGRLLDTFGSKVMVFSGTLLLCIGMMMLSSSLTSTLWGFIAAAAVIGLGLSSLLGAPMRYIMLNEASAADRTSAQGVITLFTSIGQLTSSALIGAVVASMGGGVKGYSAAYMVIGIIAGIMVFLTLGLKNRQQELSTLEQNAQAVPATD
jgi:EmrB/QacA subfamily drug resistance transporter